MGNEYYAEDEDTRDYEPCETYIELGNKLYNQAKIEQNESLLKEAFDKYDKAAQLELEVNWPFVAWGEALYDLAKIKQDASLFQEAFDKYDEAGELDYDEYISIKQGIILAYLAKINQNKNLDKEAREDFEKATKSFEETEKSILEIFVYFDKEEAELIIKTGVLYPLLLNLNSEDGKFFNEATKNINDISQLDKYKEIYVRSVFIISQLRINREYETSVAHYTKKIVAQKLLFKKSKFRLNAIGNSNDPSEGKTLLDYLFPPNKDNSSEKEKFDTEYRAFVGCFTFQHDSLNQFRLYGKDKNQEGTGLSLVFHENFFSRKFKMATEKREIKSEEQPIDGYNILKYCGGDEDEDKKYTLFRCIYIDPKEQQVETVGQKEITKKEDEKYKKYNMYINDTFDIVNERMEKLRDLIYQNPNLDRSVIEQLLINLRYLTKHIAFKEEQECRIVRICNINEGDKIHFDEEEMYIEYEPDILYEPNVSHKTGIVPRIKEVYFGPKATNIESFQDRLKINKLYDKIECKESKNPLA